MAGPPEQVHEKVSGVAAAAGVAERCEAGGVKPPVQISRIDGRGLPQRVPELSEAVGR